MADTLLRLQAVMDRTGMKRAKLYGMIADGKFPKPIKIDGCAVWPASAIDRWNARYIEAFNKANGVEAA